MISFDHWRLMFPDAARVLETQVINDAAPSMEVNNNDQEQARQQDIRFSLASQGALSWRNNVGATRAETQHTCPRCQFRFVERSQPVRYGLANDSAKMNKAIKSSDLICLIPRRITPSMIGTTIGQFGAVEVKKRGWTYSANEHERAQANYLTLVQRHGGYATFATGPFDLEAAING